ncbi:jg8555 [Pararge aegeria aegeria]|uniref:Jg8555 protein n=1 Tax=Pararge aegeria aegeria TaxID=348720 RepID=A0A8S4RHR4_9NEOP|nr:jg8555 [Pararge aegeria aegeria]
MPVDKVVNAGRQFKNACSHLLLAYTVKENIVRKPACLRALHEVSQAYEVHQSAIGQRGGLWPKPSFWEEARALLWVQVRSVYFPRELLRPASLLTNIVLDDSRSNSRHSSSCDNLFAYITDTVAPGIIVYDARRDNAWRVTHASMYPDPDLGEYDIGGDKFTLMDGVVGITHSPAQGLVYYQPLATDRIFSVSTAVLQSGPPAEGADLPVNLVGRKSSQGLGIAVDPRDDTVIFSPMTENAIAAWNPITNSHRVLAQDPDKLQFCAEVRWAERDNGAVWALSSRFHKYFKRTVSKHEINVRIVRVVEPGYGGGYVSVQPQILRRSANFTQSLF